MGYLENLVDDHHRVWVIPKELPKESKEAKQTIILI